MSEKIYRRAGPVLMSWKGGKGSRMTASGLALFLFLCLVDGIPHG